jgi:hypothetical protein
MGSQHSAQTDCGRGVLPLTKRNFMPRPSTYESEPLAMPVDRPTYRQCETDKTETAWACFSRHFGPGPRM